ncbi:MAG TPA: hypothetical protein VGZ00_09910 [Candidatus Baltobacteraceae bacterium]|nr:hypothetical protein [Candidatus Baltobacteraceae bacterium]
MKVVRMKTYRLAMEGMGLGKAEMRAVERMVAMNPEGHPIISGLRGARKARFGLNDIGKRGGGRVVYYVAVAPEVLFFIAAYPKSEQDDLSQTQRKAILVALESIKGDV